MGIYACSFGAYVCSEHLYGLAVLFGSATNRLLHLALVNASENEGLMERLLRLSLGHKGEAW